MTELSTADDAVLEASLERLYLDHAAATEPTERLEIHMAIQAVLGEQSRRLDAWITEHTKEPA